TPQYKQPLPPEDTACAKLSRLAQTCAPFALCLHTLIEFMIECPGFMLRVAVAARAKSLCDARTLLCKSR
ncbi:hypothetical protein, partial [Kingella kingae]|uniref:hypothetical protein n=1 Tax=Kingella kingae TaxID=504 RepID=UPI00056F712A